MRRRIRADRRVGLLLAGVVFLTFVAIGATIALPASDPGLRSSAAARTSGLAARGMTVYRNEGCWYCHTQQVRSTPVDSPFGRATTARSLAGRSPSLVGTERIGADLAHVGSRYGSASDIADVLVRPPRSQMPSYRFLSRNDLRALAEYLFTLK